MRATDLLAGIVLGLLVFLAAMLVFRVQDVKRLRRRLAPHMPADEAPPPAKPADRFRSLLSTLFAVTERAFGGLRAWAKLTKALEMADSSRSPAQFFYIMLGTGLGLALFLKVLGLPGVVMIFVLPLGAAVPYVVLRSKGTRRQNAFDDQLPDILMTMAASLRVGHTFRQSMQAVVKEGLEPASKEFERALLETDLGRPLDRALGEMAQRLGSRNFDYVINVVTIQREVGGSLAALFDVVSETVRQRQQFTKKVRALTAMGRISAYVLIALPFVAVALLSAINPLFTKPLFTTSTGFILIVVALVMIGIGSVLIKKIVTVRIA